MEKKIIKYAVTLKALSPLEVIEDKLFDTIKEANEYFTYILKNIAIHPNKDISSIYILLNEITLDKNNKMINLLIKRFQTLYAKGYIIRNNNIIYYYKAYWNIYEQKLLYDMYKTDKDKKKMELEYIAIPDNELKHWTKCKEKHIIKHYY